MPRKMTIVPSTSYSRSSGVVSHAADRTSVTEVGDDFRRPNAIDSDSDRSNSKVEISRPPLQRIVERDEMRCRGTPRTRAAVCPDGTVEAATLSKLRHRRRQYYLRSVVNRSNPRFNSQKHHRVIFRSLAIRIPGAVTSKYVVPGHPTRTSEDERSIFETHFS